MAVLGRLSGLLGPSWRLLGPSWRLLGASWEPLESSWGALRNIRANSFGMAAPLGALLEPKSATEACILRYFLHVGMFGLRSDLGGGDGIRPSEGGAPGRGYGRGVTPSPEIWGQGEGRRGTL